MSSAKDLRCLARVYQVFSTVLDAQQLRFNVETLSKAFALLFKEVTDTPRKSCPSGSSPSQSCLSAQCVFLPGSTPLKSLTLKNFAGLRALPVSFTQVMSLDTLQISNYHALCVLPVMSAMSVLRSLTLNRYLEQLLACMGNWGLMHLILQKNRSI